MDIKIKLKKGVESICDPCYIVKCRREMLSVAHKSKMHLENRIQKRAKKDFTEATEEKL
jgi:hypothetical protein